MKHQRERIRRELRLKLGKYGSIGGSSTANKIDAKQKGQHDFLETKEGERPKAGRDRTEKKSSSITRILMIQEKIISGKRTKMNESRTVFSVVWQRGKATKLRRSRVRAEPLQNQRGDLHMAASRGRRV